MALIRSLFWFALFLVATFVFTVIFEHGFSDFQGNAEKEFKVLQSMVDSGVQRKSDTSDTTH